MLNIVAVLTLGLLACGDKDDTGSAYDDILALTGDATTGAEVFTSKCSACHGADGSGTDSGPDLYAQAPGLSDTDLLDIMFNGTGSMPAVSLDDQEAADVLAYVQDTFQ